MTVHDLGRVWSGAVSAGLRGDGNQTLTGYSAPSLGGLSEPRQYQYGSDAINITRISEELADSGETFKLDLSGEGPSFNGRNFYLLVETSGGAQRFDLVGGTTQAGGIYRWTSPTGLSSNMGATYRVMLGEELPVVTVEAVNANVTEGQPVQFRVNIDKPPQDEVIAKLLGVGSDAETDDADLTFLWEQTAGPTVAINNATSATAGFTAPDVSADTPLTYRLTATDEPGDSSSADVTVTVAPSVERAVWQARLTAGSISTFSSSGNRIDYGFGKRGRPFGRGFTGQRIGCQDPYEGDLKIVV